MGSVVIDMSMSLDGYIAAPNDNPEQRPQVVADHPCAGDGPLEPGRPAPEPLVVAWLGA